MNVIRPALKKVGLQVARIHAFHRGLATNLSSVGVAPKVILRHANVSTTYFYIKGVSEGAVEPMGKLELWLGMQWAPRCKGQ